MGSRSVPHKHAELFQTMAGDIITGGRGRDDGGQYEAPGWLLMSTGPILAQHTHNRNKNSPVSQTVPLTVAGMKDSMAKALHSDQHINQLRCSYYALQRTNWGIYSSGRSEPDMTLHISNQFPGRLCDGLVISKRRSTILHQSDK